jgi:hypothetical protein
MADSSSLERKSHNPLHIIPIDGMYSLVPGGVGMSASSIDERASLQNRTPAPLLHLIAEVLAPSFSYHMSEELADLLERDAHLLAVMQRLILLVLAQNKNE